MASTQKSENREAIRILVADIGFNAAAAQLNIPHWRIRKWAERGNWFNKTPVHQQQKAVVQSVQSPSEAHANVLNGYKQRSVTALAKYSAEAAEEASSSRSKLNISRKAKDVADIHRTIWPVEQNQANILNLAVLVNPPGRTESNEDGRERAVEGQVIQDQPEQG